MGSGAVLRTDATDTRRSTGWDVLSSMKSLHMVPALLVLAVVAVLSSSSAWAQEATPTPSPSQTPHSDRDCPYAEFSVDRTVIKPGETVTVTARRVVQEDQGVEVQLHRFTPQPQDLARSDTSTATIVTWPLRLGESHSFGTRSFGTDQRGQCFPLGRPDGINFRVDVQPVISIAAKRNAVRDYTFTGRVLPARGQAVTLYRHDGNRRIITAQGTVASDGTYRIDRRFTGSGEFGFSVAVPQSSTNLAGSSVIRPTIIH